MWQGHMRTVNNVKQMDIMYRLLNSEQNSSSLVCVNSSSNNYANLAAMPNALSQQSMK